MDGEGLGVGMAWVERAAWLEVAPLSNEPR